MNSGPSSSLVEAAAGAGADAGAGVGVGAGAVVAVHVNPSHRIEKRKKGTTFRFRNFFSFLSFRGCLLPEKIQVWPSGFREGERERE